MGGRGPGGCLWLLLAPVLLMPMAARADPQADFSRAVAYDMANDQPHAFALYLNAARAGLPAAQFNVAVMYDAGRGTPHDAAKAALFYAFAAVGGDARAAYNLGLLYASGDGVPRNAAVARAWYQKAASEGLQAAAEKLLAGPAGREADAVSAAQPSLSYPADGAEIGGRDVPFVWLAPASPAQYYVQVMSSDGRNVLTEVNEVSATRAEVKQPGRYAWRLFSFIPAKTEYTSTPWSRFSVSEASDK